MPKKLPQCWSCLVAEPAVSLDGGQTSHLCSACWNKLPVLERMKLQLWFRSHADGGLGVRDLLAVLDERLRGYTSSGGWTLPGFPGSN